MYRSSRTLSKASFKELNNLQEQRTPTSGEVASQPVNQINGVQPQDIMAVAKRCVEVAVDPWSVANTIGPEDLPDGLEPAGNPTGDEFRGANNSPIR